MNFKFNIELKLRVAFYRLPSLPALVTPIPPCYLPSLVKSLPQALKSPSCFGRLGEMNRSTQFLVFTVKSKLLDNLAHIPKMFVSYFKLFGSA